MEGGAKRRGGGAKTSGGGASAAPVQGGRWRRRRWEHGVVSVPAGPGCPHAAHRLHQHSGGQVSPPCRPGIEGLPQTQSRDPRSKTRPTSHTPGPDPRPHTRLKPQAHSQTPDSDPGPSAHLGPGFLPLPPAVGALPPALPSPSLCTPSWAERCARAAWYWEGRAKPGLGALLLLLGKERENVGLGDCLGPLQMLASCSPASLHLLSAAAHPGLYWGLEHLP